jgi:excisionase family DNA binding protein
VPHTPHTPRTDLPAPLLTVSEVSALFRVDPRTVNRWAAQGRIPVVRTPGGHLRFDQAEVRRLLRADRWPEN